MGEATKLPAEYADLNKEKAPRILIEAINLYGTTEWRGPEHNPVILGWAKEVGNPISDWYRADETAWCALFIAVCAKRAGYQPPDGFNSIRALAWAKWGDPVPMDAMLGDILVFNRQGGGHVGLYVGEDKTCYHVLGGNQGDRVSIVRIPKERTVAIRRSPMNATMKSIRRIFRSEKGAAISIKEV